MKVLIDVFLSHRGGKCRRRDGSGFYIYDDGGLVEYERTEHDTSEDEDEDNVEVIDPNEYLQYFNYFILLLIILTIIYVGYSYYFKTEKNCRKKNHILDLMNTMIH